MASSLCCVVYDAQGARGVEVTDRVGPGQQVPGVDQVGGAVAKSPAFWRARISVSCAGVLEGWVR